MTPSLHPAEPILLVDDEPSWLNSLSLNLEYFGKYNHLLTCQESRDVIGLLRWQKVSLILLDLMMPHLSGEDLLIQLGQEHPEIPVIVLSGLNQLETAVRCMKMGAFDYYVKTAEPDRLLTGIARALEMTALHRENRELSQRLLHQELRRPEVFAEIVTRSPRMAAIFRYLEAIAASPNPVLFVGEAGSGRRLLARALHELASPVAPLVSVAGGEITGGGDLGLLFGSRGAPGKVQTARGGTLLITDLHLLPPAVQTRLAGMLAQGEYLADGAADAERLACRVIATAAPDLADRVAAGLFRRDLYHRLATHQIAVPPLRERSEDLPLLIERFRHDVVPAPRLPRNLVPLLSTYAFPGNVAELRELLGGALHANPSRRLSIEHFRNYLEEQSRSAAQISPVAAGAELPGLHFGERLPTLNEARDLTIREALRRVSGNQTIAARLLGISQPALSLYLKKVAPSS